MTYTTSLNAESILWTLCLKEVFGVIGELRLSSYIRLTGSIYIYFV